AAVQASGGTDRAVGRRASARGDERRSPRSGPKRKAARGSLLPAERLLAAAAAAARAQGRSSAPHPGIHKRVQYAESAIDRRRRPAGDAHARAVRVARKCPRAENRHRARDHPLCGSADRAEAPAAGVGRRAAGADAPAGGAGAGDHRGRSRAPADHDDPGAHPGQQDPSGGNSGHQPQDPAQQTEQAETAAEKTVKQPPMRLGIKGKQVLGVTSIVAAVVVVLSLLHVANLAHLSLEESKARAELLADAIYHRAHQVDIGRGDPYQALQSDPGLRSILESSLYSKNVTYAAVADLHDIAVAHADRSQEGQPLPSSEDLNALLAKPSLAQLFEIYRGQGRNYVYTQRLLVVPGNQ